MDRGQGGREAHRQERRSSNRGSEEEVNKRQSTQAGKIVLNMNEAKGSCSHRSHNTATLCPRAAGCQAFLTLPCHHLMLSLP